LAEHRLVVERRRGFGMHRGLRACGCGHVVATHQRERALWWYNRAFMPLGLPLSKTAGIPSGAIETAGVDEIDGVP